MIKDQAPAKDMTKEFIPFVSHEKNRNLSMSERLTTFIQHNRKIILALTIGIVVILGGFIVGLAIRDSLHANAIARVEEFSRQLAQNPANAEDSAFVSELTTFANRHSGYAGARAFAILGGIYAERQDWVNAESSWLSGARAGARTYLEPVALFNAAASAEGQGNIQGAIDLYAQAVALRDVFPLANRAQFQIGRLEESRGNKEAAISAYRELISRWPNDSGWTPLAHSRIIALNLPNR